MTIDEVMIVHAAKRGDVIVFDSRTQSRRLAKLVCWNSNDRRARVQFPRGTFATVPTNHIAIPKENATA